MNEIKNNVLEVPTYAWGYPAWIVTECEDGLYFFAAFETVKEAKKTRDRLCECRYKKIVIAD